MIEILNEFDPPVQPRTSDEEQEAALFCKPVLQSATAKTAVVKQLPPRTSTAPGGPHNNGRSTTPQNCTLLTTSTTTSAATRGKDGRDEVTFHPSSPTPVTTVTSDEKKARIAALTKELLHLLGEDPDREGLQKTPERVAKAWLEMTSGYRENLAEIVNDAVFDLEDRVDEEEKRGVVQQKYDGNDDNQDLQNKLRDQKVIQGRRWSSAIEEDPIMKDERGTFNHAARNYRRYDHDRSPSRDQLPDSSFSAPSGGMNYGVATNNSCSSRVLSTSASSSGGPFSEQKSQHNMVVLTDIAVSSICEHHLLPFTGRVHVGILVHDKVLGLSKVPKICEMYAKRLQVQERLTKDIGLAVAEAVGSRGVLRKRARAEAGAAVGSSSSIITGTANALSDASTNKTGAKLTAQRGGEAAQQQAPLDNFAFIKKQALQHQTAFSRETEEKEKDKDARSELSATSVTSSVDSTRPPSTSCDGSDQFSTKASPSATSPEVLNGSPTVESEEVESSSADKTSSNTGVAVLFTHALHTCMCARGAKAVTCRTSTSFYTGLFETDASLRAEFLWMVQLQLLR
ncbi:unnamed protein product [Amoebophrya sp. A120]|nr:unnamed protein product [Amoebophrya sp. A120]|eukprot:GSA120T00016113001.1